MEMAVKPNRHGGSRPGAGRKRKAISPTKIKPDINDGRNQVAELSARRGGARPGAGRKPTATTTPSTTSSTRAVSARLEPQPQGGALKRRKSEPVRVVERDMLSLLRDVALGNVEATMLQVRAAIAAVQYTHVKKGDGGKKDAQKDAAKKAGGGRFASSTPPKLVASGGRTV